MNRHLQGLFSYITGHAGEQTACDYLRKKGYRLIAQNVRAKNGIGANELDLIMMDKKTLVFIEVKKRTNLSDASEAITPRIQKRLYKAAELFLSQNPEYNETDCRFDVVLIVQNQEPVHLQNVIEEI